MGKDSVIFRDTREKVGKDDRRDRMSGGFKKRDQKPAKKNISKKDSVKI